jgi:hypothetical protein
VVASPDVTRPLSQWEPVASGRVGSDGGFEVVVPVSNTGPAMFYRLRLP